MIIVSRFAGTCITCRRAISAGERVSWTKGRKGAEHAACSAEGKATAVAVAASRAETSDLEVPAPAGLSYLPYQRAGVDYMLQRLSAKKPGVILADEMGLGKTVQICGLLNAAPALSTALIICPKSLAINWQRELTKWLVAERPVGRVGSGPGWEACPILIASYEQAKNPKFRSLLEGRAWDLVAVDEAHRVKNKTRALTAAQKRAQVEAGEVDAKGQAKVKRVAVQRTEATVAMLKRATFRALLTGTPFENRPVELFPLLQIADPETWDPRGKGFFSFAKRYCNAHQQQVSRTRTVWVFTGHSNEAELQERLRSSCVIRRLKADVLKELPAKRRQIIELEVSDGEVRKLERELAAGETFAEAALRLAGDPAGFESASQVRIALGVAKAPFVAEYVRELIAGGSGKVLVGAWHQQVIAALAGELSDLGVVVVSGAHSMAQRQAAVDAFQGEGGPQVFIGQIAAAGVGLTLTRSSTCVMAEEPWTPAEVTQFEDRLHRIGQRDSVNVHHLVIAGSMEAYMVKVIVAKQEIADRVLDRKPEPAPEPGPAGESNGKPRTGKQLMLEAMGALLSAEDVSRIHECLRLLAGQCDGARTLDDVGFSRIDLEMGHSLAGAAQLSPKQAALGLTLCRKYQRQLSGLGIDALLTRAGKGG